MNGFRYSLRRLIREPGFVFSTLGVLVLCLSANLLIYAVLHSMLLRPLPFPDADRLHTVYNSYPNAGLERNAASVRDYFTRRDGAVAAFESVSAFRYGSEPVTLAGQVGRRAVLQITPEFFDTLGVGLATGRRFSDAEMDPGSSKVVIVSDRFRRSALGGGDVLGSDIDIGGASRTVVGVLPAEFRFLSSEADLFLPLVSNPEQRALNALHGEKAEMLVRLKPGVSAAQALQQIEAHYAANSQGYPWARQVEEAGFSLHIAELQADHIASVRPVILLLQAGALALLLVGAANLLNLLLLRHTTAQADASVRWALGARRADLVMPALFEIFALCAAGGLLAWMLARIGLKALQSWRGMHLPLGTDLAMGSETVLVAAGASVVLACGLAAVFALFAARSPAPIGVIGATRSRSVGRGTLRLRRHFAVAQMALAFMLLAGASALVIGLQSARHADPGFDAGHSVVAALDLPSTRYADAAARLAFARRAMQRVSQQPGVQAVGFSTNVPVRGRDSFNDRQAIHVVGHVPMPGRSPLLHNRYGIAGDYFQSLGIALRQGRYLDERDFDQGMRAVVVDEDFARFYWPDDRALGQRLFNGPDAQAFGDAYIVVGVVASVRQEQIHASTGNGTIYLPYPHLPHADVFLSVRTGMTPESLVTGLRTELAALDPELALDDVRPMQVRIDDTLAAHRAPAALSALFAGAAVLLSAVGTFGLLGYLVTQGRREIGMRIALGAQRSQIVGRYLGLGLRVFAFGTAIGLIGGALLLQAFAHYLPEVPAAGMPALIASAVTLCVVAIIACLAPALNAARTPPLVVLSER